MEELYLKNLKFNDKESEVLQFLYRNNALIVYNGKDLRGYKVHSYRFVGDRILLGERISQKFDTQIIHSLSNKKYLFSKDNKYLIMNIYLNKTIHNIAQNSITSGFYIVDSYHTKRNKIIPQGRLKNANVKLVSTDYKKYFSQSDDLILPKSLFISRMLSSTNKLGLLLDDLFKFDDFYFTVNYDKKEISIYESKDVDISKINKLKKENTSENPKISDLDVYYFTSLERFRELLNTGIKLTFEETVEDYYYSSYSIVVMNRDIIQMTITGEHTDHSGSKPFNESKLLTTENFFEFMQKRKFGATESKETFQKSVIQAIEDLT